MNFYALVEKEREHSIICKASTFEALQSRISRAYVNEKGMTPRGVKFTPDDFMKDKKIVIVTIEDYVK
jgi:hypothetical protein